MQIILNKDVSKLGYRGDVVRVKRGYYRNFLLPNGFAIMATPTSVKVAADRKGKMVMAKQQLLDNAKEVLAKLKGLKLVITGKASAKGKLFGAITEEKIIDAIKAETKVKLEKDFVKMAHLKAVGTYDVVIHLGPDLEQKIKVTVKAA